MRPPPDVPTARALPGGVLLTRRLGRNKPPAEPAQTTKTPHDEPPRHRTTHQNRPKIPHPSKHRPTRHTQRTPRSRPHPQPPYHPHHADGHHPDQDRRRHRAQPIDDRARQLFPRRRRPRPRRATKPTRQPRNSASGLRERHPHRLASHRQGQNRPQPHRADHDGSNTADDQHHQLETAQTITFHTHQSHPGPIRSRNDAGTSR